MNSLSHTKLHKVIGAIILGILVCAGVITLSAIIKILAAIFG